MSGFRSIAVLALRRPRLSGARSSCAASAGSISSTSSISDFSRNAWRSSTSASSRSISCIATAISANVRTPTCWPLRTSPFTSSSSCRSTTDIDVLSSFEVVAGQPAEEAHDGQSRNFHFCRQSRAQAKTTYIGRTARRKSSLCLKLGGRAPRPWREPYTRRRMADKVQKPKKQKPKPKKDEQGVLAALPSTRPQRIGSRRVSAPTSAAQPSSVETAAPETSAAKTPAAKTTAAKTTAAAAKKSAPRATAARRKAAAPRTFEPTSAAEAAAGAADERAVGAAPRAATRPAAGSRPRPVREGAPGIGTAVREGAPGFGTAAERPDPTSSARTGEEPSAERGRPSGVELVTTAVQAVGELTQIGLTIGGRLLKRAFDRLPKP